MAGILKVDKYQDFNGNDIMTSDGSGNLTLNNAALKATPAFLAYPSADQSISNSSQTLVQINTEVFDSDGCFDTSTYKFTPTVAGKYLVYAQIAPNTATDFDGFEVQIYKNEVSGSGAVALNGGRNEYGDARITQNIVDMNGSSDFLYLYTFQTSGGSIDIHGGESYRTFFGAYKLIGA